MSGDNCWSPQGRAGDDYIATDRSTVLRRVRDRQGEHSDDYVIPEDLAAQYFDHFEVPTPGEGPLTVIR